MEKPVRLPVGDSTLEKSQMWGTSTYADSGWVMGQKKRSLAVEALWLRMAGCDLCVPCSKYIWRIPHSRLKTVG